VNTCSEGLDALRLFVVGEGFSVPLGNLSLNGLDSVAGELEGRSQAVVVLRVGVEEGLDCEVIEAVGVILKVTEGLESLGDASVGEAQAGGQAGEVLSHHDSRGSLEARAVVGDDGSVLGEEGVLFGGVHMWCSGYGG